MLEMLKIIGPKNFTLEWSWRLEVLEAKTFKVVTGGKTFDTVSVSLVGPLEIPEPVLAPVRENDERGFQVFGISTRLLFSVVWIEVFALRFQHANLATLGSTWPARALWRR
jgi:hypothetical protein